MKKKLSLKWKVKKVIISQAPDAEGQLGFGISNDVSNQKYYAM